MPNLFRRLAAALAIAALIVGLAHPVAAADRMYDVDDKSATVPMIFDVLVMRPIGLMMTVTGAMVYVFPVAPIMAITRPTDIGKPLGPLVVTPGRFTFGDPIGEHPTS